MALKERIRQNQMNALARLHHRFCFLIIGPDVIVREDPGGIDHDFGFEIVVLACFQIGCSDAFNPLFFLQQRRDMHVIDNRGANIGRCLGKRDGKSSIIELSVIIKGAAAEAFSFNGGDGLKRLFAGRNSARARV